MVKKNLSTPENRQFWNNVEKAAKEVESWPEWKKGFASGESKMTKKYEKAYKVRDINLELPLDDQFLSKIRDLPHKGEIIHNVGQFYSSGIKFSIKDFQKILQKHECEREKILKSQIAELQKELEDVQKNKFSKHIEKTTVNENRPFVLAKFRSSFSCYECRCSDEWEDRIDFELKAYRPMTEREKSAAKKKEKKEEEKKRKKEEREKKELERLAKKYPEMLK